MYITILIKKYVANFLYKISCLHLFKNYKYKNFSFILSYHRVYQPFHNHKNFVQPGMFVFVDTLKKQFLFLKSNFTVLPLFELIHRLEIGLDTSNCCAITFDDGWLDNYTFAYPVLKELQLPATIFLATGFIGTDRLFWPEELSSCLQGLESVDKSRYDKILQLILGNVPASSEERLDKAIMALKSWEPQKREDFLAGLRLAPQLSVAGRMLMNWDEVREMQASGLIEFGAHSHNHVMLDQVSLAEAEQEIKLSRDEIEHQLGVAPTLFAYPNGNYTPELEVLLIRHGFKGAVTTRKDWFGKGDSPFTIPRIGMHEDVSNTIPLFLARILFKRF